MNEREAQLARLHKLLSQRAHAMEIVLELRKRIVPAEKELASLEQSVNQLIAAIYPTTLPALPQEQEGRAFRDDNGNLPSQVNTVVPEQVNPVAVVSEEGNYILTPSIVPAAADPSAPKKSWADTVNENGWKKSTCANCAAQIYESGATWYHVNSANRGCEPKSLGTKAVPVEDEVLGKLKQWAEEKLAEEKYGKSPYLKDEGTGVNGGYVFPDKYDFYGASVNNPEGNIETCKWDYPDGTYIIKTVNHLTGAFEQTHWKKGLITNKLPSVTYLDHKGIPIYGPQGVITGYYDEQMKAAMKSYILPSKTKWEDSMLYESPAIPGTAMAAIEAAEKKLEMEKVMMTPTKPFLIKPEVTAAAYVMTDAGVASVKKMMADAKNSQIDTYQNLATAYSEGKASAEGKASDNTKGIVAAYEASQEASQFKPNELNGNGLSKED